MGGVEYRYVSTTPGGTGRMSSAEHIKTELISQVITCSAVIVYAVWSIGVGAVHTL